MIFIVPLQDEIDTTPLRPDAPEFSKMPNSQCKTCGEILPLQVLYMYALVASLQLKKKTMRMLMKNKIRMFRLYPAVRTLQQSLKRACVPFAK
ncbi:unnamed protein product [Boreogadus saida]